MKILFFDGVCSLCNEWVDFAMAQKSAEKIYFASLQGETAKQKLKTVPSDTVVFLDEENLYTQSEAIFRLMAYWQKPFPWAAKIGLQAPKSFTDRVYDWIAKNRLSWFGTRAQCRVPTEAERAYFLP